MKKIIPFTLISLILFSCHNSTTSEEFVSKSTPTPKVAPCIEKAFAYFIGHEKNPDTSVCYVLEFLKGYLGNELEHTRIAFGPMHKSMPLNGFKGLITIGDYKLLVFDESNIGTCFYNTDSLKNVDLSSLKFTPEDTLLFLEYTISDGFIDVVCVQPDDFISIEIDSI
ncbi:MAG: hypothetical protein J6X86_00640 [Bacteroidales bacterium]|nr:hypothetical protein [Bacteroidales bacterium]